MGARDPPGHPLGFSWHWGRAWTALGMIPRDPQAVPCCQQVAARIRGRGGLAPPAQGCLPPPSLLVMIFF